MLRRGYLMNNVTINYEIAAISADKNQHFLRNDGKN